MAKQQRDPARARFWRDAVSNRQSNGSTVRAFCRQRHVTEALCYIWRREFRRRDARPPSSSAPAFVAMTIVAAATVEVRCPWGTC
jgi:transposase-like protein